MKIYKRLLLAGLTLVVASFAMTASASAAVWKMGGVNVTKFIEVGFSGGEVFESGTSGMSCEVKATLTTEGGSTGKITKFETVKCSGGFGELSTCTLKASESKGLPWTVDVNATDLTITNMRLRRTFSAGCPITELDKTLTSVTMTLDNTAAITATEYSGAIAGYKAFGSFTVNAPNSGTYGIG